MPQKSKKTGKFQALATLLQGSIISRLKMFSQVGLQYGGDRDIYEVLGYERILDYTKYAAQYERHDIAKAIIDRPVKATWRGKFQIVESDDDQETELEKAYIQLEKELRLCSVFARADKLSCIGHYGIILLGLDDVKNASTDFLKPVSPGARKLLYVKPLAEGSSTITGYETDPYNPRYGKPVFYDITFSIPGQTASQLIKVHHSRVIHITYDLLEDEVEGMPILQALYNRLYDLEKLVGASAEMFWRGARPGYLGKIDKDYAIPDGFLDTLQDQFDEFDHNFRRFLVGEGLEDIKALAQQLATDPEKYFDLQIQCICALTGMPKRILLGSERGELASGQDQVQWREVIQDRRIDYAEPVIVRPFVDRCIDYKILPPAGEDGYSVIFNDLWAPSEKELVDIGKIRAEAVAAYSREPLAQDIIPPEAFYEYFLGLNEDQKNMIIEIIKNNVQQETGDFQEEE